MGENGKLRLRRRVMETELKEGKSSSLNHRAITLPYLRAALGEVPCADSPQCQNEQYC